MIGSVSNERSAFVAVLSTAIMWGLTGVFVRLLPPISPFVVTAGRFVVALSVILPVVMIFSSLRQSVRQAIVQPVVYLLASFMGGYYLLATAANQSAPATEVSLVLSTSPLFVILIRVVSGDIPSSREVIGAGVSLLGVVLILLPHLSSGVGSANTSALGYLFAGGAAAMTALYTYVYRQLSHQHIAPHPVGVIFVTFFLGSTVLGVIVELHSCANWALTLQRSSLRVLVELGIICTAVPGLAFSFASKRLAPVKTATVSLLIPLFTAVFSHFFLSEELSASAVPGALLLMGGLFFINRKSVTGNVT